MTDDELDNQLRGAMKVLDAEVPSGYLEGLPQRTLARLEDRSMEPTMTTGSGKTEAAAPPPQRDEDSGLHDIRSLAQSTKQRLSKKITAVPPMDEDVLASSSAGWKAVALPEPAKMISLPELDQLPSKKQIKEQQKAAKAKAVEVVPTRAPTHLEDSAPVAKAAPAASMSFGANIVGQKKSKAPLYALVGVGLAAAAGGIIYVATQGKTAEAPAPVVAKADTAPTPPAPPAATAQLAAPATPPPADTAAATGSAEATPPPPPVEVPVATSPSKKGKPTKADATTSKKVGVDAPGKPETKKPEPKAVGAGKEAPKDGSEPNFDDLLKEAGVKDGQKAKKPVLDKKSLSGADFKAGMNSIAGRAAACYAGTQGTAAVKLTVAPSGQVSKASVSGPFAGTAVAACVEAAVRGATFPAWEGGPQSFNYSFLLAE